MYAAKCLRHACATRRMDTTERFLSNGYPIYITTPPPPALPLLSCTQMISCLTACSIVRCFAVDFPFHRRLGPANR